MTYSSTVTEVLPDGWSLDVNVGSVPTFFGVIRNGQQTPRHGWAQGRLISQWG